MPMRKPVRTPTLVLLALLALLAPRLAPAQQSPQPAAQSPQPAPAAAAQTAAASKSGVYEQLNLFGEAFERIRQDAVEPVGDRKLIETAISGMLASLDPNCVYLTEDEYKTEQTPAVSDTSGSTGLVVTIDAEAAQGRLPPRRRPRPAAQAGIKPGEPMLCNRQAAGLRPHPPRYRS